MEKDVESAVERKDELADQGRQLEQAITRLREDIEASALIASNLAEKLSEKAAVDAEIATYKEQAAELQERLDSMIHSNSGSLATLKGLESVGEDVQEGLRIVEERQALIETCTEALQSILDKLEMASLPGGDGAAVSAESAAFSNKENAALSGTLPFSTVAEYMAAHNYGAEDYPIYSQDPVWQALAAAGTAPPDSAAVHELIENAGNKWSGSLPASQREAIHAYTGSAYANINSVLRGLSDRFSEGNYERAVEIHKALLSSPLPADCIVYRGVSSQALGKLKGLPDEALVGKVFRDKGFMSTSLNRGDAFGGDVLLEIEAPRGTPAAYVGHISQAGHYESEVLFDVNRIMKITSARRDMNGRRIIRVRIMNR